MDILDTMRTQTALYWAPAGTDIFGNPMHAPARELRVRWEDVNEQVMGMTGEVFVSKSKVYVGEDVARHGALKLARLTDLPPGAPLDKPFDPGIGGEEIDVVGKLPTLDGTEYLRTVWL